MKLKIILVSILYLGLCDGQARGDTPEIARLEAERGRLVATRDSLLTLRGRIANEAERLSVRVDSLKSRGGGPEAPALRGALRGSPGLAARLEALDRNLERVHETLEGARERLRAAYGREIELLIGRLTRIRDEALARRLRMLEEARAALGPEADAGLADTLEGLSIRPGDGPDEIRQKADMLEDGAARIRAESAGLEGRLRRLETERRLRNRAMALVREVSLFDEGLPEGRVVSSSEQKVAGAQPPTPGVGAEDANKGVMGSVAPPAGAGTERAGISATTVEIAREEGHMSLEGFSTETLASEIERLKARRKEATDRERSLTEKAATFRVRLARMLEERD